MAHNHRKWNALPNASVVNKYNLDFSLFHGDCINLHRTYLATRFGQVAYALAPM